MAETKPFLKLLPLLLLLLLHFPFSFSTIPLGSVIFASGSNQNWPSPNSTFSVSFVPGSSPNSFLSAVSFAGNVPIWSAGTVDSQGSLRLLKSGSLRLTNGSGTTVWDSGTDRLGVTSGSIEDTGEFILRNNRSVPVWSSFDNPTDTIAEFHRRWNTSTIYWNLGLNSSISSNLTSPSLGLVLRTNGVVSIFDSNLRGGVDTVYSGDYGDSDTFRFLKLDDDGNLRIYSSASRNSGPVNAHWSAVDQCLVYGYCGNFGICSYNGTNPICSCPSRNFDFVDVNDRRKGCKRKVELSDCSGNTTMLDLPHTRLFTYENDLKS
ncbi:unnamed protein product [Arabidopsis arenosa]|uniref:non-specific serine/threonine protein kinase n=1 Tax=Arabidopsis arenosa TaxID=38785 RepID=A0A8S2A055_ARAAE|nr:unnamed protein product [Arabidopsis arenosa]